MTEKLADIASFAVFASARHIKMSPRKVRLVVDLVRGRSATDALALLKFTPNVAADPVRKLIASAVANAEETYGLERENLFVAEISVDGGPTQRRGYFGGRSRWKPVLKRSSHIHVALREKNPQPLDFEDGPKKPSKS